MSNLFLNYYIQSLGSCLSILACIFSYLNGYMFVYGNILNNIDNLSFLGLIASILLFPFCIISLILGLIKLWCLSKQLNTLKLDFINRCFLIVTIILGFMGCNIYFIIPFICLSFGLFKFKLIKEDLDEDISDVDDNLYDDSSSNKSLESTLVFNNSFKADIQGSEPVIKKDDIIRMNMAIDLLNKNIDLNLIKELTGLSSEDLQNISKRNL